MVNRRDASAPAGGGHTHPSRQHQRGLVPVEKSTSESVSSSEEDMTWEDFLATTDDLTNSSAGTSAAPPPVPPPAGRRRSAGGVSMGSSTKNAGAPHSRLQHSLAPNQSQVTRIPVSSGSGLYPRGPSDDSAVSAGAAAAGVLSRSGGAPSGGGSGVGRSGGSQGALLASRGKEAGVGYGSGFTSWGKGGGKDAEHDDPESADSVVSGYDGSVADGGAQVRCVPHSCSDFFVVACCVSACFCSLVIFAWFSFWFGWGHFVSIRIVDNAKG